MPVLDGAAGLIGQGVPTRQARWLVETVPGSPWHNMAEDEALLEELIARPGGLPTVRLYEWDRPSISIGRLQPQEPVERLYPSLPCVRRPTGGRAVVHGRDLTVTVCAATDWLPRGAGKTVAASHRLLIGAVAGALEKLGHHVLFGTERQRGNKSRVHCFDLAAGCDLVDADSGRKLVGSAQRRECGVLLQQVSLPLDLLGARPVFEAALRVGLGHALALEEWLLVDTTASV